MSESQYKRYKDIPPHSLGAMANQLWHEDPKMLGIHLARYKFVAKMLRGKAKVAEVGCGDGFYSHIVRKEVGNLILYDLDPSFNDNAVAWDITQESLWHDYKAIYSLDCFEHIASESVDKALLNITLSLSENGTFIIGMPSLESQEYASLSSKHGHVNCMSGDNMKALLDKYFHNVFMFGMNDETIHTGFFPMCHYLIGVCAGVR